MRTLVSGERHRKFELALKHQLRNTGTPDRDSCVDAETLGAWADGGLDAAQMSAVEVHVSSCARCQAIVATAARSAPVMTPAPRESIFRFPKWALAPLAAAAAIAIWMVVPQDTLEAPPTPSQVVVPAERSATKRDAEPSARDAAVREQVKETGTATEPKPTPAVADKLTEAKRERADAPAPAFEDRQQRPGERSGAALGAAAANAPRAAAAPAPDAMLQKSARFAASPLEIVSPDASSRWRIVDNAIERSEDGGVSWVPIRAAGGDTLSGGVSPSRSVCWLIGSNGLVMVTVDGVAFARVPLPERAEVTSITATDARSATVTTADGRRFRTDDSGRTWRQI
jgi:hypothetical protein